MFDSIINDAQEKFGLGDKAGALVSTLLALMTDKENGGFAGFINHFREVGLGDLADSWVSSGANTPISNEQVESAFGEETLRDISAQVGTDYDTTVGATGYVVPHLVDDLTPDGEIPSEGDLLSRVGGYLTGGGALLGGAAASLGGVETSSGKAGVVAQTFDRVDPSVGNLAGTGTDAGYTDSSVTAASADGVPGIFNDDTDGGNENSLSWLLPLIITGILVVLGYWFCSSKSEPVATVNANVNKANSNTSVNTNASANANVLVNTVNSTNINSNVNSIATNTDMNADRTLTEVSLPNGTKLQAYPNGIEDQLIKFIDSDEYKNGTADSLKNKWFSFDDLNFKFGTTELVPESKRQLDNIVAILKAFPDVKIKIGGYTDKKGDDAANKKLSDNRAKAVKAALEKSGVGAQVPEAEGYGEEFATVPETAGDAERQVDRKTSVRLLK